MKSLRGLVAGSLMLIALMGLLVLPALAQENSPSTTQVAQDSSPADQAAQVVPAVPITTPTEDAAELDWTYRYMIPTAIALGVIVIVATSAQYFTAVVRKRYRIVEE